MLSRSGKNMFISVWCKYLHNRITSPIRFVLLPRVSNACRFLYETEMSIIGRGPAEELTSCAPSHRRHDATTPKSL